MKLIYLACTVFLILSCKKDIPVNESKPFEIKPDSIIFHDFNPDIDLSTVRYFRDSSDWRGLCEGGIHEPILNDSSLTYKLDVDSDGIHDIQINLAHGLIKCSTHCSKWGYGLSISGINLLDFINYSGDSATLFYDNSKWSKSYSRGHADCYDIRYPYSSPDPSIDRYLGHHYIGIKTNFKIGWIHVFKYTEGLKILDYAINLTPTNPIYAGQTK